ncbi:MAG: GNAT family N-acetyltransferase [Chloroflexota bacterium]|nr:GNAT family N-acetyltransferase [Chloroflexota bacterium]
MLTDILPAGYTARPATRDDLDAVIELLIACDVAEYGEPDTSHEDLLADWEDLDLATDTWIAIAPDGEFAAYADVIQGNNHTEIGEFVQVHPGHYGRGLGTCLLRLAEARAREHVALAAPGARVSVHNIVNSYNPNACSLLRDHGYTVSRRFRRMHRDLDAVPPEPSWPEGISVRSFVPGQDDRAVFEAVEEAFLDHWGHSEQSEPDFERWMRQLKRADFDPSVWFLALDGEEIAGVALCWDWEDVGWLRNLGVRRPWRKRGIGSALLRHVFREFHARGKPRVGLGVDSESLTGATRLYEQAGMHITRQFDRYEKELRPASD